ESPTQPSVPQTPGTPASPAVTPPSEQAQSTTTPFSVNNYDANGNRIQTLPPAPAQPPAAVEGAALALPADGQPQSGVVDGFNNPASSSPLQNQTTT
ncbi:MAG: hypothetical protein HYV40_05875, partial [Candidatus Levybacteria bacterium]|nr:hypothetical protein [Candidatus Levybacteria bacterium]